MVQLNSRRSQFKLRRRDARIDMQRTQTLHSAVPADPLATEFSPQNLDFEVTAAVVHVINCSHTTSSSKSTDYSEPATSSATGLTAAAACTPVVTLYGEISTVIWTGGTHTAACQQRLTSPSSSSSSQRRCFCQRRRPTASSLASRLPLMEAISSLVAD